MQKIFSIIGKTRSGKEVRIETVKGCWFIDIDIIIFWNPDEIFDTYAVCRYVASMLYSRKESINADLLTERSENLGNNLEWLGLYNELMNAGQLNQPIDILSYGKSLAAKMYK